jgi:multiple sugar transport system substrate-binding protein
VETSKVSRRSILGALGRVTLTMPLAYVVAACGGSASAPPAASTPAGQAANANAAPTSAPAAQGAANPAPAGAIVLWYGTDYLPGTTDTLKALMDDFTKKSSIPTDFELKSGSWGDQLNAAVQAGSPPDIWQTYDYQAQYWNAQGQALDVTDVVNQYQSQKGGLWPYVTATITAKGKAYAIPLATNTWPLHVRQDILDSKNGGKWPTTWDETRAAGKAINDPPNLYAYGWTMGKTNDANNHFIATLWTFGGKLQNDDGTFGLKADDEAALAVLDLASKMYNDDKIIPPASVQWDDGGNNNAFQGSQVAWTSNPLSVYGWLLKNKPEIAKTTILQNYPKGPAGSFGQVDVWCVTAWKGTKQADKVRQFLDYVLSPDIHAKRIQDLHPRFTPIYQDLLSDKIWDDKTFQGLKDIAKTARIMAYAASPQAGYATFTTQLIIGEMMQNLLVKKMPAKDAFNTFYQAAKNIYSQYSS